MSGHDRDRCVICVDDRTQRLVRRGVSRGVVAMLRACLTDTALPFVRLLEDATPEQIASVNERESAFRAAIKYREIAAGLA